MQRTAHSIHRTGFCRAREEHLSPANEATAPGDLTAADLAAIDEQFPPKVMTDAEYEALLASAGMTLESIAATDRQTGQQRREQFERKAMAEEARMRDAADWANGRR